jgi:hypothetical protein
VIRPPQKKATLFGSPFQGGFENRSVLSTDKVLYTINTGNSFASGSLWVLGVERVERVFELERDEGVFETFRRRRF